jgi:hypothetical protein
MEPSSLAQAQVQRPKAHREACPANTLNLPGRRPRCPGLWPVRVRQIRAPIERCRPDPVDFIFGKRAEATFPEADKHVGATRKNDGVSPKLGGIHSFIKPRLCLLEGARCLVPRAGLECVPQRVATELKRDLVADGFNPVKICKAVAQVAAPAIGEEDTD